MTKSVFWQKRKEKRRSAYCFERKKKRNFSLIEDHSRGIGGPPALLAHGEQRPYYSYHKKKKKNSHNIRCFILAKMKNTSSKFHQNFIQFSNFAFIHFSFFNFKFIQLRYFRQFWLNSFKKILENIFQSLLFFNLKMLKKKNFR